MGKDDRPLLKGKSPEELMAFIHGTAGEARAVLLRKPNTHSTSA